MGCGNLLQLYAQLGVHVPQARDRVGTLRVSVGDDMFIGGQPTEKALRELKAKGVTTVVNLRMPEEMARVGFDEAALAKELGITYVYIPMRGSADYPYGPKQLDTFAAAMAAANGKVLLHCTIAWRVSQLWARRSRERRGPVLSFASRALLCKAAFILASIFKRLVAPPARHNM